MTEQQLPNQPPTSNRRTAERRTSATPAAPVSRVPGYVVEFIPAERRMQDRRERVWALP